MKHRLQVQRTSTLDQLLQNTQLESTSDVTGSTQQHTMTTAVCVFGCKEAHGDNHNIQSLASSICNNNNHKSDIYLYPSQIKKVCTSPNGTPLYLLSNRNQLYVIPKYSPSVLLSKLTNVIDIQSTERFSIALCAITHPQHSLIAKYYCRIYSLPTDLHKLLISFSNTTAMYTTTNHDASQLLPKWRRAFDKKPLPFEVVKISSGDCTILILGNNGYVWRAYPFIDIPDASPLIFKYPQRLFNGSKIIDIATGGKHNLVLDENGNVYCWGGDDKAQCPVHHQQQTRNNELILDICDYCDPVQVESLKNYKIDAIKCGYQHSYCRTMEGHHYMWGSNQNGECLVESDGKYINAPYKINMEDILRQKLGVSGTQLVGIKLGKYHTEICLNILSP